MKKYEVLVKEIEDYFIDNQEKPKRFNEFGIEREKLIDKALYDITSIEECLTVSMNEYNIERNKKQSFDNRAGLIVTVLLAIILTIYDKIPLKATFLAMKSSLTFITLLEILTVVVIYFLLSVSLYYAIKIIFIKSTENFDIKIINSNSVGAAKLDTVSKLLEIYLNLINIHRNKNHDIAKQLARSQLAMIISIILIIIKLNIL